MTQELIDKLITHYEGVISKIRESDDCQEIGYILETSSTMCGICHCAIVQFDEDIYDDIWVKSKCPEGKGYWTIEPTRKTTNTIAETIECLQIRVDIMKTFKEEKKDN